MPDSSTLSVDDLMKLVEATRQLSEQINLPVLLRGFLDQACALTDSSAGSVILLDEKLSALYFAAATGPKAEKLLEEWGLSSQKRIPLVGSKAGEVFTSGESIMTETPAQDPTHFKGVDSDTKKTTDSMVCVALRVSGKRIGVVQILNKRAGTYAPRDLALLEYCAAQAAIAIRNAQMLNDLMAHMGLYASQDEQDGPLKLWEELRRPPHKETITVMFADMRSFTQLCQQLNNPERVLSLLEEFLGMLVKAVVAGGGVVNKFLGDGVLAFFRGDDHAVRGLRCAARMVDEFQELRARWDSQTSFSLSFLDIGIGLATDSVIVGAIDLGRVRDFTAIGTAVNLAEALMKHARGGRRILIDRLTFRAAKDIIGEFEGPEPFELKGSAQQVGLPYERYHIKRLSTQMPLAPDLPPTSGAATSSRGDVFISYSHRDQPWLDQLKTHLAPYVRRGSLTYWDDSAIKPGSQWREQIQQALGNAKVAVLLVSPNFLCSEFISANELPPLLSAAGLTRATILWVPVSASSYDETEIEKYQAALDPGRPLDAMTPAEQNASWVALCKKIKTALHP